ncbi:MAG TPA: PEP-CTERM sorting domain-containing protein [Planctomycetota bacterium]|nr:PEP-CTERM sorting domain-containing protein [Planctomycetota bacterium]HRR78800.1 PEP-CTERM sorting domain-containing protein [Planctomycetota bacterium]HRT94937.1 PEP-CTERM sorting domain-containing protein [Planctomycetota bacterium]
MVRAGWRVYASSIALCAALLWCGSAQALFISTDIGGPGLAGSVAPVGAQPPGPVAISGSGADIWGTADQCHFWYDTWVGDFVAIARFTGLVGGGDAWRKVGLMARTDTTAGSAMQFLAATPQQIAVQWRDSAGAGANWPGAFMPGSPSAGAAPFWMMLKRLGNTYTAHWAPDVAGVPGAWSLTNVSTDQHVNPGLPASVQLGIAVTAHNNGELTTGSFDHFTIAAPALPQGRLLAYDHANIGGAAYAQVLPAGQVEGPVHWELWRMQYVPGVMSEWYLNYNANSTANLLGLATSGLPHQDYLISQIAWSNVGGGSTYPPETPFTGDMGNFSTRHYGQVLIPDDPNNPGAPRTVRFHDHNDDWAVLVIDGLLTSINDGNWTDFNGGSNGGGQYATLSLTPGWHDFEFFQAEGGGGDNARLLWDYDPQANLFGAADVTIPTDFLRVLTPAELLALGDYNIGGPAGNGIFYNIGNRPGEDLLVQLRVSYQGDTWSSPVAQFTGVPEPATCLLLVGGLMALARRRRRLS